MLTYKAGEAPSDTTTCPPNQRVIDAYHEARATGRVLRTVEVAGRLRVVITPAVGTSD
jgi:hypothetical protein